MSMNPEAKPETCNVGGQAVLEGVMMRSPRSFAVACRRASGEIVVREAPWRSLGEKLRFLRWPFIRGGVVLVESLMNGMSALSFAARQQELDLALKDAVAAPPADQPPPATSGSPSGFTPLEGAAVKAVPSSNPSRAGFTAVLVVSLIGAVLIFKALPHVLTTLLGLKTSQLAFHLVDGALKVLLLVGYVGLIGLMKDIQRVYQYHGAEHKSIWAHERGLPLTVESVRQQTRFHPRCGTSFLLLVILVSVLLFALLLRYPLSTVSLLDNLLKIVIKVPLMLPVAGLAYEGIKLSGKFRTHPVVRVLVAPGLLLQRLTTREPADDQLEVALVALQKALWRERSTARVADEGGVQVFASYAAAQPALQAPAASEGAAA